MDYPESAIYGAVLDLFETLIKKHTDKYTMDINFFTIQINYYKDNLIQAVS
jgi:hypothetical protein